MAGAAIENAKGIDYDMAPHLSPDVAKRHGRKLAPRSHHEQGIRAEAGLERRGRNGEIGNRPLERFHLGIVGTFAKRRERFGEGYRGRILQRVRVLFVGQAPKRERFRGRAAAGKDKFMDSPQCPIAAMIPVSVPYLAASDCTVTRSRSRFPPAIPKPGLRYACGPMRLSSCNAGTISPQSAP